MIFAKPILAVALSTAAAFASAGTSEPYTQARFDQLAAEGKPAVVAVHADWCPTCKAQKPILSETHGEAKIQRC